MHRNAVLTFYFLGVLNSSTIYLDYVVYVRVFWSQIVVLCSALLGEMEPLSAFFVPRLSIPILETVIEIMKSKSLQKEPLGCYFENWEPTRLAG